MVVIWFMYWIKLMLPKYVALLISFFHRHVSSTSPPNYDAALPRARLEIGMHFSRIRPSSVKLIVEKNMEMKLILSLPSF